VLEYLDLLVRKGFIVKINGLYNTAPNPSYSACRQAANGEGILTAVETLPIAVDSICTPAPQKYWSVTFNDFVGGPARVIQWGLPQWNSSTLKSTGGSSN
jgi:hypothetical protein